VKEALSQAKLKAARKRIAELEQKVADLEDLLEKYQLDLNTERSRNDS
jgi:predicted  nucleic acid-binding Zn-ribbon protein